MSEVCSDFQRNKCFRANCRFAHPGDVTPQQTEACKDFLANKCTRGSRCRFSHGGDDRGGGGAMAAAYGNPYGAAFDPYNPYANPFVNPYGMVAAQQGYDQRDIRTYRVPQAQAYPPVYPPPASFGGAGKERCRDFLSGKCNRDNCRFDHSLEQCVDYIRGTCQRGSTCRFSHQKEVCRDFVYKGGCKFGDDCKFSHDNADEVKQSTVPACRDFLKGSCTYEKCKYRHDSTETGYKRIRDDEDAGQPPSKQTKVEGEQQEE